MLGKNGKSIRNYLMVRQLIWSRINEWDFNWRWGYYFNRLIVLPPDTEITHIVHMTIQEDNPTNQNNPPKYVSMGWRYCWRNVLPASFVRILSSRWRKHHTGYRSTKFPWPGFATIRKMGLERYKIRYNQRIEHNSCPLKKTKMLNSNFWRERQFAWYSTQPTHYLVRATSGKFKVTIIKIQDLFHSGEPWKTRILVQKFLVSN